MIFHYLVKGQLPTQGLFCSRVCKRKICRKKISEKNKIGVIKNIIILLYYQTFLNLTNWRHFSYLSISSSPFKDENQGQHQVLKLHFFAICRFCCKFCTISHNDFVDSILDVCFHFDL